MLYTQPILNVILLPKTQHPKRVWSQSQSPKSFILTSGYTLLYVHTCIKHIKITFTLGIRYSSPIFMVFIIQLTEHSIPYTLLLHTFHRFFFLHCTLPLVPLLLSAYVLLFSRCWPSKLFRFSFTLLHSKQHHHDHHHPIMIIITSPKNNFCTWKPLQEYPTDDNEGEIAKSQRATERHKQLRASPPSWNPPHFYSIVVALLLWLCATLKKALLATTKLLM